MTETPFEVPELKELNSKKTDDVHGFDEEKTRKIDFLLSSARKLHHNKEFTLALQAYKSVLILDRNNPQAWRGMGLCLEYIERFDDAVSCFSHWVRLTQSPESYAKLASAYLKLNDDENALHWLQKSLLITNLSQNDAYEIHNHMGNCYLRLNNIPEAEKCYLAALAIKPRSDRTLTNLGTLFFQKADHEASLKNYREALQINPLNTRALSGLGLLCQERKQWKDAVSCFTKALDQDAENMVALYGLIKSGQTTGQFDIISKYIRRYLAKHPANTAMLYSLAGNYFYQGLIDECLNEIQKIEILDPLHDHTQELKILALKVKNAPKTEPA